MDPFVAPRIAASCKVGAGLQPDGASVGIGVWGVGGHMVDLVDWRSSVPFSSNYEAAEESSERGVAGAS